MRSLEILERDGRRVRALRVFCPARCASMDASVCAACSFVHHVSDAAVTCAPPGRSDVREAEPGEPILLGPDAIALRTPVGAVCAPHSVAVRFDVPMNHVRELLDRDGVVVVLTADDHVHGVVSDAPSTPTLAAPASRGDRVPMLPESAPLVEAIELMVHGHLRRVHVMGSDRQFVGHVTDLDVLGWVARCRPAQARRVLHPSTSEGKDTTMSEPTTDLKAELKKSVTLLQTLRDEVRVQLHLAGMEAKEGWKSLEPRLEAVERAAQDASEASRVALVEAVKVLKDFRNSLR